MTDLASKKKIKKTDLVFVKTQFCIVYGQGNEREEQAKHRRREEGAL